MKNISPAIFEINTFISGKNDLDDETISFLMNLKEMLLISQDNSFTIEVKKKKLPEIEILLRIVGKKAFVDCYDYFKNKHIGKKNNIVKDMFICGGAKSDNSARTKASIGSKIFKKGLHIKALENIIDSNRVSDIVIEKAKNILNQEDILEKGSFHD